MLPTGTWTRLCSCLWQQEVSQEQTVAPCQAGQGQRPTVPSQKSRAGPWWQPPWSEADQQGKSRSEASKTRSGPVRYLAWHGQTCSIAQARAKCEVFELTNTPWTKKFQMKFLPALFPRGLLGTQRVTAALEQPNPQGRRRLLMYLGPWQLSPLQKELLNYFHQSGMASPSAYLQFHCSLTPSPADDPRELISIQCIIQQSSRPILLERV